MNLAIDQMLKQRNLLTLSDRKHALREIVQEILLSGLSRAGFFRQAAFSGGTALRIFHGLDRFSEDLDFSLKKASTSFDLNVYLPILEKEIGSYGLSLASEPRGEKRGTAIQSAFFKGSTKGLMLSVFSDNPHINTLHPGELIKVKLEVDVDPPDLAQFENQFRLLPFPYEVTLYDPPSLFAGKIHAVLCRAWRDRVKGRDLHDYVFHLAQETVVNLPHLVERLRRSGFLAQNQNLDLHGLKELLCKRFEAIDFDSAKKDVFPFIQNPLALDLWSAEFFCQITGKLKSGPNEAGLF